MTIDMTFWNQAYGYLSKRMMDRWAAEDLASVACVRMVAAQRRAERGEVSIENWNAYGWIVIRSLLIDYYRTQGRWHVVSWPDEDDWHNDIWRRSMSDNDILLLELPVVSDSAEQVANDDSWQRLMKRAQLTDKQAEVMQMRFVEGCQFDEIAQRMGQELLAVNALRWRAVGKLRALVVR